ncbi:hypothetical protein [Hyphomonas sp.]|jgi:hypothetical protein
MTMSLGSGPPRQDPNPWEMTMADGFDFSAMSCVPAAIGAHGGRV